MKQSLIHIIALMCLLTTSCSVSTQTEEHVAPTPPPDNSSPELARIKSLVGKWSSRTSIFGKKDEEVFTEYALTAGGSAVVEKIFPGTQYEMMSVYFDNDEGKLSMTHYCIMKNRPHFTLAKSGKDEIKLDVTKVEGLKSKDDPSMGAMTLHFIDNDNFTSTCGGGDEKKGDKDKAVTMKFTRVK